MKKALSVFLSILMIFAALSVGVSAESVVTPSPYHGPDGSGKPATYDQAVIEFNLGGGTLKNAAYVYNPNTGMLEWTEGDKIKGTYVMVPMKAGDGTMTAGTYVTLPIVTAPAGYQFDGWYCTYEGDGSTYAAGGYYKIPAGSGGQIITFRAAYSPTDPDEGPQVFDILIKVFGTIIGLLMYNGNTEAGIALMEKIFGGIME